MASNSPFCNLFFLNQCVIYREMRQKLCFGNSPDLKQTIQHRINGQVPFFWLLFTIKKKIIHTLNWYLILLRCTQYWTKTCSQGWSLTDICALGIVFCVENTWIVVNRKKIFEHANCVSPYSSSLASQPRLVFKVVDWPTFFSFDSFIFTLINM